MMKRNLPTLLSITALLVVILSASGLAIAGPLARPLAAGGAPTMVSYQGQITVGGSAYSGDGYFKFAVVNLGDGTTYWANDGTASGQPTSAVQLTVSNGLFDVLLGDTSLTNMTALPATAFDGPDRALRVWFSSDGTTFSLLSPDRQIAAVPYALQAEEAKNAGDADTLDGQDGSAYQNRVSGDCAPGSMIRVINADGTVICDTPLSHPVAPTNTLTTTLDVEYVGTYTSITIGTDGLGLISYYDDTNDALKVAHCEDTACTSVILSTLDSPGGKGTSITIGTDGLGLISYYDYWDDKLKVAHCNDTACTSAVTSVLDTLSWVGEYTSITIGADGLGLISYYDEGDSLQVAHCDDIDCTSATLSVIDDRPYAGEYNSITIGVDGLGLISYYDADTGNYNLMVAHCDNINCTSASTATVDTGGVDGDVGMYNSITIGAADGLGLISYYDYWDGYLKVAHCDDIACTSATATIIDIVWDVGLHTSITIGADGLGLISYYDETNDDLKAAHLGSVFGVPYSWQR